MSFYEYDCVQEKCEAYRSQQREKEEEEIQRKRQIQREKVSPFRSLPCQLLEQSCHVSGREAEGQERAGTRASVGGNKKVSKNVIRPNNIYICLSFILLHM